MSQKYYCPYCNHEYSEVYFDLFSKCGLFPENGEIREYGFCCSNCYKKIKLKMEIIINYELKKQCEWNNEKHQWKDIGNECVKCNVCDYIELKKNAEGWKE